MNNSLLQKVAKALLTEPEDYQAIYACQHELHELYAALSGIGIGDITDKDILLPSGKAISPIKAAFCMFEMQRTAVFTRGICKAIRDLQNKFPGEKIHILYAGCGPYATLLTPLTTIFSPEEVSFHLLDINPASIEAVRAIYQSMELEAYISAYHCEDATTYIPDHSFHMMVSETMMHALVREPQVAIMQHLIPYLSDEGLFIPQEITVTATLLNRWNETHRYLTPESPPLRIPLGMVYRIGRENYIGQDQAVITVPQDLQNNNYLYLLTDIRVYKEDCLGIYHSSLNEPILVTDVKGREGKQITFRYAMGSNPHFTHEWISS